MIGRLRGDTIDMVRRFLVLLEPADDTHGLFDDILLSPVCHSLEQRVRVGIDSRQVGHLMRKAWWALLDNATLGLGDCVCLTDGDLVRFKRILYALDILQRFLA